MRQILLAILLLLPQATRWTPYADTILTNGKIVTVDANFSIAQALAINDGKLIAVGTDAEGTALGGPNITVVDLAGKAVIPGLQDSHIHFLTLGEDVTFEADQTYSKNAQDIVNSVAELIQRRNIPAGEWIRGSKW